MKKIILASFLSISFIISPAFAAIDCKAIINKVIPFPFQKAPIKLPKDLSEMPLIEQRQAIINSLSRQTHAPSFIKTTNNQNIPVILLNKETLSTVAPLLESSIGFMDVLQKGYNNDHGLMRIVDKIIDADAPGYRGFGEINNNGLAWKHIPEYLKVRNTQYSMVEVSYMLTKSEKETAQLYQRARRASIFLVPFTFGNAGYHKDKANVLKNLGENCFGFCRGATVSSGVKAIESILLEPKEFNSIEELLNQGPVKKYLEKADKVLLEAQVDFLRPDQVTSIELLSVILEALPKSMKEIDGELVNLAKLQETNPERFTEIEVYVKWIYSHHVSSNYSKLLSSLKISQSGGFTEVANGRPSFAIIYDSMNAKEAFDNATYTTSGAFWTWDKDNQKPLSDGVKKGAVPSATPEKAVTPATPKDNNVIPFNGAF